MVRNSALELVSQDTNCKTVCKTQSWKVENQQILIHLQEMEKKDSTGTPIFVKYC